MTARVDVDLAAFEANLRRIRTTVAPAQHLLVVKDDAYGHGLETITRTAIAAGVRWFGTFDVDTAQRVRRVAGPAAAGGARILAWTVYGDDDIRAAIDDDIELGLGTRGLIGDAARVTAKTGGTVRVHLKVDSGLHRNGIRPEGWADAVADARAAEARGALRVEGVWSHIAEASDAEDDASREIFVAAANALGDRPVLRHLAASAAAFARAEFRFDLVRIGAFAYGIRPSDGPSDAELGIRPIATLVAPVAGVDGGRVTVAVGSLDGLDSRLAGRWDVATPAGPRTLLSISATQCEVEGWPDAAIGDEVALLGGRAHGTMTDAAEILGTIGEQVMLRISPRLERRYR
jgi:alanine racemase